MAFRIGDVSDEYRGVELGDLRLERRLRRAVNALDGKPAEGFPAALGSESDAEAYYRFIANPKVTAEKLLEGHLGSTMARMSAHPIVLVVHDTTEFAYRGDARRGLGRLQSSSRGFLGHFALALSGPEKAEPLGVIGVHTWVRGDVTPTRLRKRLNLSWTGVVSLLPEQRRWGALVEEVAQRSQRPRTLIHVMDSEADDYTLITKLISGQHRFVIRGCYDRLLATEKMATSARTTKEFIASREIVSTREVAISRRGKRPGQTMKNARSRGKRRDPRIAKLALSASAIVIRRPGTLTSNLPGDAKINLVAVREIEAPSGVEPVEWLLVTTEPIDTVQDIERVVDIYRARWMIEEYFKCLKTGCAIELRQHETYEALRKALYLLAPIAWRLLALRTLSREYSDAPASIILTPTQIDVLSRKPDIRLRPEATICEAMNAIARLGGHKRSNGEPGWIVLNRGYRDLIMLEIGFLLATSTRCVG